MAFFKKCNSIVTRTSEEIVSDAAVILKTVKDELPEAVKLVKSVKGELVPQAVNSLKAVEWAALSVLGYHVGLMFVRIAGAAWNHFTKSSPPPAAAAAKASEKKK